MNSKLFFKVFILDLLFLFLFIFLSRFFISKVYGIIVIMQGLGGLISNYENVNQETITYDQAIEIGNLVNQLNANLGNLIFNLVGFLLIIFILYLVIKSIEWNLIYYGELVNYKKYLKKFFGFTLLLILLTGPLSYYVLIKSRIFLIGYLFEDNFQFVNLSLLILMILINIFIIYLIFCGYVYINNMNILNSIKKILKFEKFYLFLVLILIFFILGLILRYRLLVSVSIFSMIFLGFLISFIFTLYKFYLSWKLK